MKETKDFDKITIYLVIINLKHLRHTLLYHYTSLINNLSRTETRLL